MGRTSGGREIRYAHSLGAYLRGTPQGEKILIFGGRTSGGTEILEAYLRREGNSRGVPQEGGKSPGRTSEVRPQPEGVPQRYAPRKPSGERDIVAAYFRESGFLDIRQGTKKIDF